MKKHRAAVRHRGRGNAASTPVGEHGTGRRLSCRTAGSCRRCVAQRHARSKSGQRLDVRYIGGRAHRPCPPAGRRTNPRCRISLAGGTSLKTPRDRSRRRGIAARAQKQRDEQRGFAELRQHASSRTRLAATAEGLVEIGIFESSVQRRFAAAPACPQQAALHRDDVDVLRVEAIDEPASSWRVMRDFLDEVR